MNQLNYASREAAQRLQDAGIVLEADFYWCQTRRGWKLHPKTKSLAFKWLAVIPAPSMAEVWRELPEYIDKIVVGRITPIICLSGKETVVGYGTMLLGRHSNTNPTDALIDLLIWVRKEPK